MQMPTQHFSFMSSLFLLSCNIHIHLSILIFAISRNCEVHVSAPYSIDSRIIHVDHLFTFPFRLSNVPPLLPDHFYPISTASSHFSFALREPRYLSACTSFSACFLSAKSVCVFSNWKLLLLLLLLACRATTKPT